MHDGKPLQLSPDRPVKTSIGVLIALGGFIITSTSGFYILKGDVKTAHEEGSAANVRVDKLEAQLKEMGRLLQMDHDAITRIDENVKILKEKQK